eukprot:scaffold6278_cov135-Skeletonema_dohrnii-CCMP3373.AAC.7
MVCGLLATSHKKQNNYIIDNCNENSQIHIVDLLANTSHFSSCICMLHSSSSVASGIRGFTPIKGRERERRLKSSSTSSSSKSKGGATGKSIEFALTSGGGVVYCTGNKDLCERLVDDCLDGDNNKSLVVYTEEDDSTSKSKSSSKRVRRLSKSTTTSKKSKTASSFLITFETDRAAINACLRDGVILANRVATSPSTSSSTSSSSSSSKRGPKRRE